MAKSTAASKSRIKIGALLFATLVSSVALVALVGAFATATLGKSIVERTLRQRMETAQKLFAGAVEAEAKRAATLAHGYAVDAGLQALFAARDRAGLAARLVPGFGALKARDGVVQLQFHTPPATSFLRVGRPEKFGDDLSSFRHTVVAANATDKPVLGLESGVEGLGVRAVEPIDVEGRRLGTVEVGLAFGDAFFARFKHQTGDDVAFYLAKSGKLTSYGRSMADLPDIAESELANAATQATPVATIEIGGASYARVAAPVRDYQGEPIGVAVFFANIAELDATVSQAHWRSLASGAVAILVATLGAWLLNRRLVHPLCRMTRTMSDLAAGHDDIDVPDRSRDDEIGAMAAAVQSFKDAALAKKQIEQESREQRARADREHEINERQVEASAREQRRVVDVLARGLDRIAAGELAYRIHESVAAEYEELKSDFNRAITTFQSTMRNAAASAADMRTSASEIHGAADDLARRTEHEASSLEEAAAALNEISATVGKVAENAEHASREIASARAEAEASDAVVRQAAAAMGGIERSAGEIGRIVAVIDEIAFQTNLLALNAGVEAARAGESGRGFAVVASEVRALSGRTAEAAKEVKSLIAASGAEVAQGVARVGDAGKALQRIASRIVDVAATVRTIAAGAREQATGLAAATSTINELDAATQRNAAMAEQANAASLTLNTHADELAQLISGFAIEESSRRAA